MAYFPFFVEIENRPGLVIGGGVVALRKVEKLLPYGPELTVVAEEFCPELEAMEGIRRVCRRFAPEDVEGMAFVIAATDCREVNHQAAALCREKNILVNVVDDREACGFLFPALVKEGDLSIGISTGGASPTAAIYLKEKIGGLLPEHLDEMLAWLDGQRDRIIREIPEERRRAKAFARLFRMCMERGGICGEEELAAVVDTYRNAEDCHE